jgi:low temperature requirement protein LtrA
MVARDTGEEHRVSTPLELLFDLCFVVAVSQAAARLHHALAAGHLGRALLGYAMVFFAIWWAWMNFTWFASAYDTDDVLFRLATLVQITGALILAAGVPRAFDDLDAGIVTLGYAVMRLALVAQWLRASRSDPPRRTTARRFAAGVSACMVGWFALLAVPGGWHVAGFALMACAELSVPVWAEHADNTPWHPRHIAERYGLFTLIVLGESVLAATVAIQTALDSHHAPAGLYPIAAGGLLTVFSMWWIYFAKPAAVLLAGGDHYGFIWGYGHLVVFSSAAAVGAGLAVAVDHETGHGALSRWGAGAAVTVPVALFLLTVWLLHVRPHRIGPSRSVIYPGTAVLVLAGSALGGAAAVLATGLLMALLVVASTWIAVRTESAPSSALAGALRGE